MSDSEENFQFDDASDSGSDGYVPAAKKGKAAKAPPKAAAKPKARAASGAAAKKKAASKVLKDHDDNVLSADDMDFGVSDDDVPAKPIEAAAPRKDKTASETYQKFTPIEHILKRPDSYIGSVERIKQSMWTFDSDTKRMVHRAVSYVPGFYKIVDEILVNAADNKINDPNMDTLKINIDPENNTISVWNNGRGIPIEIHSTENMYIPEMIFGNLLTSSNYDDNEKKLTGGRNGYGAKLTNIYSHRFTVETADKKTAQKYKQSWKDNMSVCEKPKITKNGKKEEFTCVSFEPDLARFGMDSLDDDIVSLLKKRVYDMAGTVKDIKVYLNDERLKIKNFKQYVEMYLESAAAAASEESGGAAQTKPAFVYEQVNERWEIAFAVSDGTPQHVSFANSIATTKGGTHVAYVADQIAKKLVTAVEKKNKGATVKASQMKNHMWIFVNALIENPTFDSQTKEQLTLPASKFGSRPSLSDDFMKKVAKSSLIENVLSWAKFKADKDAKKTDGTKRTRLTGMVKLTDANRAGGRYGKDCTLILTEGDSAKGLALAGLDVVGHDNFGVFPLRGKMLNVREAKHDQIMKNEEIQAIKKIIGLQHNKQYTSIESLRYGKIMIMADQDHDGSHIKGLLINFLDHFYPSLLKLPEFLVEFVTPIVRVTKGNRYHNFFTLHEFRAWQEATADSHRWIVKYYKGLGTSKPEDGRDYFGHMEKHVIPFAPCDDEGKQAVDLAFSKKRADERKDWLRQLQPDTYLDHSQRQISLTDFINKELILFSQADNVRSIPSGIDGLKPGQRKVIWSCFKRKLKGEIKVAQLVGYISEHAAYHHGEASLGMTIVNLAQDFVGSNNVNLLLPNGIFGSREMGGKDAAAFRYIYTELSPITRTIFHPSDEGLLKYLQEDNDIVEPEWYMPIVPVVLLNGAEGIGTGWSTSIPCFNPVDIVTNIRHLMRGEEQDPMMPWWRGYKGSIRKIADQKFEVTGIATKTSATTVEITELAVGKWTQAYKAELEAMMENEKENEPKIKDYTEHHTFVTVNFHVTLSEKDMAKAEEKGFAEYFKLTTKINTSNMICFDKDGKIKKYNTAEEIIEDFYPLRLSFYQKRKDHLAAEMQKEVDRLNNQARFVQMIVDKKLNVSNRKKADIVAELRKLEFTPFPKKASAKAAGETAPTVDDPDEEEDVGSGMGDYDYLLGMAIWSLTKEKIEKLKQQALGKEEELKELLSRTPAQMWDHDLDQFLLEWDKIRESWTAEERKAAAKKGKQGKLKTRLSIGKPKKGGGSDSEDDFRPTKAAARKAEPKARVASASSSKATTKKVAALLDDESDFEEYTAAPTTSRAAAGAKRAGTASTARSRVASGSTAIEIDDDDEQTAVAKQSSGGGSVDAPMEIDDSDAEPPSKPPPKKAPAKKKVVAADSDDEPPKATAAAKGRGKAAPKRKSPDGDDDDAASTKPAKKKKLATDQAAVTDYFEPASSKSKAKTKAGAMKAKPPAKKAASRVLVSDDDEDASFAQDDAPPPRAASSKRTARGAAKTYVEIGSDDGDDSFAL